MPIKITLLYAGLMGLMLLLLAFNVTYHWVRATGAGQQSDQTLRRAERVLSSFVEFVPLILILMALLELRTTPETVLHGLGITAVAARLAHAFAMNPVPGAALLRLFGAQATYLVLLVASLGCIYFYALGTL